MKPRLMCVLVLLFLFSMPTLALSQDTTPYLPGGMPEGPGGWLVPPDQLVPRIDAKASGTWTGPHYAMAMDTATEIAVVFCTDGSYFGGVGISCAPIATIGSTMITTGRSVMLYWEGGELVQISLR